MEQKALLKIADLAELLDVPKSTLYSWVHLGKGPAPIKVGGLLRWRRDVVERWLDERTRD